MKNLAVIILLLFIPMNTQASSLLAGCFITAAENTGSVYSTQSMGQSFTSPSGAYEITEIQVQGLRTNSPAGNITAHIYAHSGTFGVSGIPTGSSLGSSDGVLMSGISTSLGTTTFSFSTPYELTASTNYFFVLAAPDATPSSNNYQFWGKTPSACSGNNAYSSGASWSAQAAYDGTPFAVIGEEVGEEDSPVAATSTIEVFEFWSDTYFNLSTLFMLSLMASLVIWRRLV